MNGTVAASENSVARLSSLGEAISFVEEKPATGPVPPEFPQAPQVNHVPVCTSERVVGALPEGVGVGEGDAVGVGDAPATGVPAVPGAVLPPQPITINKKPARMADEKRFRQLRTVPPLFLWGSSVRTVLSELGF